MFEVVGFRGTYHTIIGRPRYARFIAVPNYTYLKLKMSGPKSIITVGSSNEHTYNCDIECVEHREAMRTLHLALVLEGLVVEAPKPKRHAGNFEPIEDTKKITLDPNGSNNKALTINTNLGAK